jgi:hypothetical protein
VKGLIFNLLDAMARQSGCADEAWDLVMEFVASESEASDGADSCLAEFGERSLNGNAETPLEAVLQRLGGEGGDLFELPQLPEGDGSYREAELIRACDRLPLRRDVSAGEGFSHDLLSLLEQLLAEALVDEEEEEAAEERLSERGYGRACSYNAIESQRPRCGAPRRPELLSCFIYAAGQRCRAFAVNSSSSGYPAWPMRTANSSIVSLSSASSSPASLRFWRGS